MFTRAQGDALRWMSAGAMLTVCLCEVPALAQVGADRCPAGHEWSRRFVACIQSGCGQVEHAHLSYSGECVCGSSGSVHEDPDDPNGECTRPHDDPACPGCTFACVHLDEPCPGEEPPVAAVPEDDLRPESDAESAAEAGQEQGQSQGEDHAEEVEEPAALASTLPGVVERDGQLHINCPPGGTLELTAEDLPAWARPELVTLGAMVREVGPPSLIISGDTCATLGGVPLVKEGDRTSHGGVVEEGSDRIFINGVPAAVQGSFVSCHHMTALPGVTTSFNPHHGGLIAWNCGAHLDAGPSAAGFRDCMRRLTERPEPSPPTDPQETFCRRMEIRMRLNYAASLEYSLAARGYAAACLHWRFEVSQRAARRGERRIEVEPDDFEVGDTVLIGHDASDAEQAKVIAKGSLILDRPLEHDHPAGALVSRVPDGYDGQPAGDFGAGAPSGPPLEKLVPVVAAGLLLFLIAVAGVRFLWRRSRRNAPRAAPGRRGSEASGEAARCATCGAALPPNARFCGGCGAQR